MKILYLTANFSPQNNAAAIRNREIISYWKKWNHKVTVLTSSPTSFSGEKMAVSDDEADIHRFSLPSFYKGNFVLRSIVYCLSVYYFVKVGLRILKQDKYDIIFVDTPHLLVAYSASLLSRIKAVPFFLYVADLWPESIASICKAPSFFLYVLRLIAFRVYHRSRHIFFASPNFTSFLVDKYKLSEKKITLSVNGVKDSFIGQQQKLLYPKLTGIYRIGYAGNFGFAQDLSQLISFTDFVRKNFSKTFFQVHLLGGGAQDKILREEVNKKLLRNFFFNSEISYDKTQDKIKNWDFGVVCLKNDRFFRTVIPSKFFLYLSVGIPVIYIGPQSWVSAVIEKHKLGLVILNSLPFLSQMESLYKFLESRSRNLLCKSELNFYSRKFSREKQSLNMIHQIRNIVV